MIVSNLIILFTLIVSINAYSAPGAYERMYFYYAYLMDADHNSGLPSRIAPGCAKAMGHPGTKCSFNEFLSHISETPLPIQQVTNLERPDVVTTADTLTNWESSQPGRPSLTGKYTPSKLIPGLNDHASDKIPSLFNAIGRFVEEQASLHVTPGSTDTTFDRGGTAVGRVMALRQAATSTEMKEYLEKKGFTVVMRTKTVPEPTGPGYSVEVVNPAATKKANPKTNVVDEIYGFMDESHTNNIASAEDNWKKVRNICAINRG